MALGRTAIRRLVCGVQSLDSLTPAGEGVTSEREAMYSRYLQFASLIKGGSIHAHWMADKSSFWYADGVPDKTIIYKVDPKANTKTPLFDPVRLRQALAPVLGHEPPYQGLPFAEFAFVDESETAVRFTVEHRSFILDLDTYVIISVPSQSEAEKNRLVPQLIRRGFLAGTSDVMELLSPDQRWFVLEKDYNLWLRSTYDGRQEPLTSDGIKNYAWTIAGLLWSNAQWSPDGGRLAVLKEDTRHVLSVPIVHWLKPTEEVEWVHYTKAGGPMPRTELYIVNIHSKRQVRVDIGDEPDQYIYIIGWTPDSSELVFCRINRVFKTFDIMAADPTTGSVRLMLKETQETFIKGTAFNPGLTQLFTWLKESKKFIWMSERDGWDHLYLYGLDGTLIRRLTRGAFPVLQVVTVDEQDGWVYFTAHADTQHPYNTHLYRVNLEGKGFTALTKTTGQHTISFAPSQAYFLDTYSSSDRPPTVELRTSDGRLLQTLSHGNIEALRELRWSPPEEFVVKAADEQTDLYGLLYKPYDFDPEKKYPVLDFIYGGPQTTWVPRTFTNNRSAGPQALAQLGFIVFIVDGRGTPERGKAFQDVVYGNFGRHEIPDHVATLQQLAAGRSYIDLDRVGIIGSSWGGYMTVRAMLLAPEVYHVGIATNGVMDFYDHIAIAIEPYMGLPAHNRAGYEYGSNLRLAGNLKGRLLLIHGTSDVNCTFSATIKMVEALVRAGKSYDLLVLPEQNHWFSGTSLTYYLEAIRRYLQEHLKP